MLLASKPQSIVLAANPAIYDRLVELAQRPSGHTREDRPVALGVLRGLVVVELLLEVDVLLDRRRAGAVELAVALELDPQPRVLGAGDRETVEVAVDVLERPRDPVRADLERAQYRGAAALRPVEEAAGALAEVDRDQREREQDEHSQDDPPCEGVSAAGGERRGRRALDGRAQDRQPRVAGAGTRHELRLEVSAFYRR